ncbi:MAG: EFR1 family ferrodoxin [Bacteroides sp.]|nr:EFR1 family ferrodoxin [Bacteroides sp.]MCM1456442.1 EFR1 family ferrodoxin [Lachnoclostridium sp.]
MIFYFSGTGNSLMTARRIAAAIGGECADIAGIVGGTTPMPSPAPGEPVGLVCPVYFFVLPDIVERFISMLSPLGSGSYTFAVVTYGTMTGMATAEMRRLFAGRGIALDAVFSVRMVDVWTPMFNLTDSAACLRRTDAAIPKIDHIINMIRAREKKGNPSLPALFVPLGRKVYDSQRATCHFRLVDDRCIGCGLCARGCPAGAIEMQADRPFWHKERCTLCLRCLHRCPGFAILYGSNTARHGQFINPYISPRDL